MDGLSLISGPFVEYIISGNPRKTEYLSECFIQGDSNHFESKLFCF